MKIVGTEHPCQSIYTHHTLYHSLELGLFHRIQPFGQIQLVLLL